MARPVKIGLDYFPFDVYCNTGVQLIEAEFGLKGFALYVKFLQRVYSVNGYYMMCDRDVLLLFSREVGEGYNCVSEILKALIRRGIFDKGMYDRYSILTSELIQLNYLAAKKKTCAKIDERYRLIKDTQKTVNVTETPVNVAETPVNVAETPQRVKESKLLYSLSAVAPTLEEVRTYCLEINSRVNPDRFYDYYQALNWSIKGTPIADWKSKLKNWEQNERSIPKNSTSEYTPKRNKFVNYNQPVYTKEEIQAAIKRKNERAKEVKRE